MWIMMAVASLDEEDKRSVTQPQDHDDVEEQPGGDQTDTADASADARPVCTGQLPRA